jgi:hypothetical protein
MRPSRNFLCALFGVAMTIFSWFSGSWAWPAWPALATIALLKTSFADLPYAGRAALQVLLITINTAAWAIAAWIVWWIAQRLTARRRPPPAAG